MKEDTSCSVFGFETKRLLAPDWLVSADGWAPPGDQGETLVLLLFGIVVHSSSVNHAIERTSYGPRSEKYV